MRTTTISSLYGPQQEHAKATDWKFKWYKSFEVIVLTDPIVISIIKGNNKITELRTILQRESQNS